MEASDARGEQLQLALETDEIKWSKLEELSLRERALARELDEVREQLHEHARAMKLARVASVEQIASRLGRNRQRVNAWMRNRQQPREPGETDREDGWRDPEGHVPL